MNIFVLIFYSGRNFSFVILYFWKNLFGLYLLRLPSNYFTVGMVWSSSKWTILLRALRYIARHSNWINPRWLPEISIYVSFPSRERFGCRVIDGKCLRGSYPTAIIPLLYHSQHSAFATRGKISANYCHPNRNSSLFAPKFSETKGVSVLILRNWVRGPSVSAYPICRRPADLHT